jgi:hypothetical protein
MLAASLIGIFLIPVLYVVFQWLREKVKARVLSAPVPECAPETRDARSVPDVRSPVVDPTYAVAVRKRTH